MTGKTLLTLVVSTVAFATAACEESGRRIPLGPTPVPAPTLFVFTDGFGFGTSDVRDAQNQILQFTTANELIFVADGTRLSGYRASRHVVGTAHWNFVSGNICPQGCEFEVRFGIEDGEKRAYLTVDYGHDNPGTMVDVEVSGNTLLVTQTTTFPPGTPTLSGVVSEMTATGAVPLAGVSVLCSATTGWQSARTDDAGFYRVRGLVNGSGDVSAGKEGYRSQQQRVTLTGDATLDIQLTRVSAATRTTDVRPAQQTRR